MFRYFVILCLIFLAFPIGAVAECGKPRPADVVFRESDAVFVGRVLSVTNEKRFDPWVYEFAVFKVWKGQIRGDVKIYSIFPGCGWGYDFQVGQSYLVYANHEQDRLSVYDCSRTSRLDESLNDIVELDRIIAGTPISADVPSPVVVQHPWLAYGIGIATGIGCTCLVFMLRRLRTKHG